MAGPKPETILCLPSGRDAKLLLPRFKSRSDVMSDMEGETLDMKLLETSMNVRKRRPVTAKIYEISLLYSGILDQGLSI